MRGDEWRTKQATSNGPVPSTSKVTVAKMEYLSPLLLTFIGTPWPLSAPIPKVRPENGTTFSQRPAI